MEGERQRDGEQVQREAHRDEGHEYKVGALVEVRLLGLRPVDDEDEQGRERGDDQEREGEEARQSRGVRRYHALKLVEAEEGDAHDCGHCEICLRQSPDGVRGAPDLRAPEV